VHSSCSKLTNCERINERHHKVYQ
jgi:hypothetical protein